MSILKTLAIYLIITFQFWLLKSSLNFVSSSDDFEDDSMTGLNYVGRVADGSSIGKILSRLVRTVEISKLNGGSSLEGKF